MRKYLSLKRAEDDDLAGLASAPALPHYSLKAELQAARASRNQMQAELVKCRPLHTVVVALNGVLQRRLGEGVEALRLNAVCNKLDFVNERFARVDRELAAREKTRMSAGVQTLVLLLQGLQAYSLRRWHRWMIGRRALWAAGHAVYEAEQPSIIITALRSVACPGGEFVPPSVAPSANFPAALEDAEDDRVTRKPSRPWKASAVGSIRRVALGSLSTRLGQAIERHLRGALRMLEESARARANAGKDAARGRTPVLTHVPVEVVGPSVVEVPVQVVSDCSGRRDWRQRLDAQPTQPTQQWLPWRSPHIAPDHIASLPPTPFGSPAAFAEPMAGGARLQPQGQQQMQQPMLHFPQPIGSSSSPRITDLPPAGELDAALPVPHPNVATVTPRRRQGPPLMPTNTNATSSADFGIDRVDHGGGVRTASPARPGLGGHHCSPSASFATSRQTSRASSPAASNQPVTRTAEMCGDQQAAAALPEIHPRIGPHGPLLHLAQVPLLPSFAGAPAPPVGQHRHPLT